jgi:hypothetical protein
MTAAEQCFLNAMRANALGADDAARALRQARSAPTRQIALLGALAQLDGDADTGDVALAAAGLWQDLHGDAEVRSGSGVARLVDAGVGVPDAEALHQRAMRALADAFTAAGEDARDEAAWMGESADRVLLAVARALGPMASLVEEAGALVACWAADLERRMAADRRHGHAAQAIREAGARLSAAADGEVAVLEWLVAEALEGMPGPLADDAPATTSPLGLFQVVCEYEEGDITRWQPRRFGSDGRAMLRLVEAVAARGCTLFMSFDHQAHADIMDSSECEIGRYGPGPGTLPEAVLRAVAAALPALPPAADA